MLDYKVKRIVNPSQKELRELAIKYSHPILKSAYGNLDRITRFKARMAKYTYVIAPESDKDKYSHNIIDPKKAQELIERQKRYIESKEFLIEIQGYLGLGEKAVPVLWLFTPESANIAGMQQVLAFPREEVETPEQLKEPFKPKLTVVFASGFIVEDMPGKMAVVVDLDNYINYVMGSDYFGESKKGALRLLNDYVYQLGGLVFHAGAKAVKIGDRVVTMAIMGLSGTGKTTTTFSKQGELTQPIQDDMISLWPDKKINVTENGCFAKTYGLKPETEPIIYKGTVHPDAWVENVYMNEDGTYDFSKDILTPEEVARWKDILIATGAPPENVEKYIKGEVKAEDVVDKYLVPKDGWDFVVWTQNGRSIIPMSIIEDAADLHNIPPLKYIGILNRDEGPDAATPGIVKFASAAQAAGYFLLGETSKTSAAGKERGKTRSPFTNPFFPRRFSLMAERYMELTSDMPDLVAWMMNTGYVGGDALDEKAGRALKVKIRHSSAMLEAMLRDAIKWTVDPDFGYYIVDVNAPENAELLEKVPAEILQPRLLFEKQGRLDEYEAWVRKMKKERKEFLESLGTREEIIKAVVNE